MSRSRKLAENNYQLFVSFVTILNRFRSVAMDRMNYQAFERSTPITLRNGQVTKKVEFEDVWEMSIEDRAILLAFLLDKHELTEYKAVIPQLNAYYTNTLLIAYCGVEYATIEKEEVTEENTRIKELEALLARQQEEINQLKGNQWLTPRNSWGIK